MRKIYLLFLTSLIFLGVVGCASDSTTEATNTYSEEVWIEIEDTLYVLGFSDSNDQSIFKLIETSSIELDFNQTEYGNMITEIGSIEEDSFHWISFTKNNDFANEGLDTIDYEDGDVFTFTAELKTWQQTLIAEYQGLETEGLMFALEDEIFYIVEEDLSNDLTVNDLIVGMRYQVTGSLDSDKLDQENFYIVPDNIEEKVIDDFTELYTLNEGDIVYIMFTVTALENSYEFGYEVFAEDVNGLSSRDISEYLNPSYTSDYIFYTFPNEMTLAEGKTYIGRFIYKTYAPNENPQFGLYTNNIQGNEADYFVIEIEE